MSEKPNIGDSYYMGGQPEPWTVRAYWKHPDHGTHHRNWTGEYIILQVGSNFKNPLQMVKVEDWPRNFSLAFEAPRQCKFCGFTRMRPCEVLSACPNLIDYSPRPSDPEPSP